MKPMLRSYVNVSLTWTRTNKNAADHDMDFILKMTLWHQTITVLQILGKKGAILGGSNSKVEVRGP